MKVPTFSLSLSSLVVIFLLCLPSSASSKDSNNLARKVVKSLSELTKTPFSSCEPDAFKYFPHSGPQQVACFLLSLPSVKSLSRLVPMPIFKSGPHQPPQQSKSGLITPDLNNEESFGHYNQDFLVWLNEHVLQVITQPKVVKMYQASYDAKLKPFFHSLYISLKKIENSPKCFAGEVAEYRRFIEAQNDNSYKEADYPGLPYERYYYFMNRDFCNNPKGDFDYFYARGSAGDSDGNVIKGCVSWWIRRTIDGSAPHFKKLLKKLIQAYDPALISHNVNAMSAEEQVSKVLGQFEDYILSQQAPQIMKLMAKDYIQLKHDQLLDGNSYQFIEGFFCGLSVKDDQYVCLISNQINSLQKWGLRRIKPNVWSTTYTISGVKVDSQSEDLEPPAEKTAEKIAEKTLSTIRRTINLVKRHASDGAVIYRIIRP